MMVGRPSAAAGLAMFPHLDLRIPFGPPPWRGNDAAAPLRHAEDGRSTTIDGFLLRLNVRPRRAGTITYMSRFAYTMQRGDRQRYASEDATRVTADPNTTGTGSMSTLSASPPNVPVMCIDATSRSVLRLKPHHVATVLYALHGGIHSPPLQCSTSTTVGHGGGGGWRASVRSDVDVMLRDEMFEMRVESTTVPPRSSGDGGGDVAASVPLLQCLRISGTSWREGFTSCDAWVEATPKEVEIGGDAGETHLGAGNVHGVHNLRRNVFPSPVLTLTDAAQLVAMRTFLEGALLASFDF